MQTGFGKCDQHCHQARCHSQWSESYFEIQFPHISNIMWFNFLIFCDPIFPYFPYYVIQFSQWGESYYCETSKNTHLHECSPKFTFKSTSNHNLHSLLFLTSGTAVYVSFKVLLWQARHATKMLMRKPYIDELASRCELIKLFEVHHVKSYLYEEFSLKTTIVWLSTSSDANNWLSKSA